MTRLQRAAALRAVALHELAAEYRRQGRTEEAGRTERHAEVYERMVKP